MFLVCLLFVAVQSSFNLIRPDETHEKFIIDEEAVQFLQNITNPISVVTGEYSLFLIPDDPVVGPLHTGKSFLMNQILGKNTFGIGHRVTPKTMV